ncbi:MAG TPA: YabP/YqfC family sporulation protein [Clostridia bacterium]
MSSESNQVLTAKTHTLQCDGRKKLSITGVKEVINANDVLVLIDTSAGVLEITGSEIKIQKYNADEGGLVITGEFSCFKYDQTKTKGFIKRLFK